MELDQGREKNGSKQVVRPLIPYCTVQYEKFDSRPSLKSSKLNLYELNHQPH